MRDYDYMDNVHYHSPRFSTCTNKAIFYVLDSLHLAQLFEASNIALTRLLIVKQSSLHACITAV